MTQGLFILYMYILCVNRIPKHKRETQSATKGKQPPTLHVETVDLTKVTVPLPECLTAGTRGLDVGQVEGQVGRVAPSPGGRVQKLSRAGYWSSWSNSTNRQ